jgi:signal transduction histidine kinase
MDVRQQLQEEYVRTLAAHLAKADEAALNHAYELGRKILADGFGVLDQVMLHNDSLVRIIVDCPQSELHRNLDRAADFLAESLSPFEMSLRGYREANTRLKALHETLEQKIEERTRELVKASKVKDDFLAMVSHELRTPLTSIASVIKLLDSGAFGSLQSSMHNPVKLAQRNCERLMRIVNDLLDLTKIAGGTFDLILQSAELEPILLEVIESRQVDPAVRNIKFVISEAARGVRVSADPLRIQQVLDNLLANAVKYSDAKYPIEIAVERRSEFVRVGVTDHGTGIAGEHRDKIFMPFSQADQSSTRTPGGIGLGLSIARAIVEAHRGTIEFCAAESRGTTFYFDLPIEDAQESPRRLDTP